MGCDPCVGASVGLTRESALNSTVPLKTWQVRRLVQEYEQIRYNINEQKNDQSPVW
jgi:hypothetical protein